MINTILDDYRHDEAAYYADLAHIVEAVADDEIDHCMDLATSMEFQEHFSEIDEDAEDVQDFLEHVDELPDDEDDEIQRILESTSPLTYDQMIGLEPIEE